MLGKMSLFMLSKLLIEFKYIKEIIAYIYNVYKFYSIIYFHFVYLIH